MSDFYNLKYTLTLPYALQRYSENYQCQRIPQGNSGSINHMKGFYQ